MKRLMIGLALATLATLAAPLRSDPPTQKAETPARVFYLPTQEQLPAIATQLHLRNRLMTPVLVEVSLYDEAGVLLGVEQNLLGPGGAEMLDLRSREPRARLAVVGSDAEIISRVESLDANGSVCELDALGSGVAAFFLADELVILNPTGSVAEGTLRWISGDGHATATEWALLPRQTHVISERVEPGGETGDLTAIEVFYAPKATTIMMIAGPQVTYPSAAGVVLQKGTSYELTWSGFGGTSVKIELLKGSSLDRTIATATFNDGSYSWRVPSSQASGSDYRLRITSTSNASHTDVSDNDFTIGTVPRVSFPSAAGIVLQRGTSYDLTWSGFTGTRVKIELYKGASLDTTLSSSTPNDGSFAWTVPGSQAAGNDYRLKVTSTSSASQTDFSDHDFAIGTPARITFPSAAGITLQPGSSHDITWSGFSGEQVMIELYKGNSLNTLLVASTPNDDVFAWTVPSSQTAGDDYRIKVTSVAAISQSDFSDNEFTIQDNARVSFPSDAGIALEKGSTYDLTWSGFSGTRVKIELLKGGALAAALSSSAPNDGTFSWTVPASQTADSDYRLRITSTSSPSQADVSDNDFAIGAVARVTYPSIAGITWEKGSTYTITWSGFSGARVKIELFRGASLRTTISASTSNDGSHEWTVPGSLATGRNYRVRITSVSDPSQTDASDKKLAITR